MWYNVENEVNDTEKKSLNGVMAIASSTGGPKALQSVIPLLPADFPYPILIVQHMPVGFTRQLADRLNELSSLSVKEAEEGDVLQKGFVYLSKSGMHMQVKKKPGAKHVIHYTDEPPREGVKPCANYLFESLAQTGFQHVLCVVLTGMGADGRDGIRYLKQKKNAYVIAQEKESCAVYGMPRRVVEASLCDKEIPLDEMAKEIITSMGVIENGCKPVS